MKFVRDPVSWTRNVAMTCYLVLKISNHVVKSFFCTFLGGLLCLELSS